MRGTLPPGVGCRLEALGGLYYGLDGEIGLAAASASHG